MTEPLDMNALLARIREEALRPEYQVEEMGPLEALPAMAAAPAVPSTPLDLAFLDTALAAASPAVWVPSSVNEFLMVQDPEEFVELAYQAMLGRPADAVGGTYYADALRNGYGQTFVLAALAAAREPGGYRGEVSGMGLSSSVYNLWRVLRRLGLGALGRAFNAAYAHRRQRQLLRSADALRLLNPRDDLAVLRRQLAVSQRELSQLRQQLVGPFEKQSQKAEVQHQRTEALEASVGIPSAALAKSLDRYYDAFEEHCRGSEEDIRNGQLHYLEVIRALPDSVRALPVVDVGCGRGEWLSLLREAGLPARGIDASATFTAHCQSMGMTVDEGDAVAVLKQREDASAAAVSAFHLVEHLPFAALYQLIEEAHRVIAPGGSLILETPNPENVLVGSHTFYHDFSHRNPVTPTALEFLLTYCGFEDIDVRRLHPYGETAYINEDTLAAQRLNGHLYGPQDFAVIARKA